MSRIAAGRTLAVALVRDGLNSCCQRPADNRRLRSAAYLFVSRPTACDAAAYILDHNVEAADQFGVAVSIGRGNTLL